MKPHLHTGDGGYFAAGFGGGIALRKSITKPIFALKRTSAGWVLLLALLLTAGAARAQAPTITSLSTTSGPAGTSVTVTGNNLSNIRSVVLRGIPCNITPISATQASFVVPAQASTGPIRLTTTGGNVLSSTFTVTRASASLTYVLRSSSFNGINVGSFSMPAFTDLDHDGLIDMLVGQETGEVSHYEQTAVNSTSFILRSTNLSGLSGHYNSIVSVTDIDGDGLLEMVVGSGGGNLKHYEQTAANSTSFTELSNDFNNIHATAGLTYESPHFTDIDGDGFLDLLVGDEFLSRYEQTAANGGTFTQLNNQNFGPTANAQNGGSEVCVIDLDGDNRLDILIARSNGQLFHYEQNSVNSTAFTQVSTGFSGINVAGYPGPAITDLDGDGLLDLVVGGSDGILRHYEQAGTPTITSFTPTSGPVGQSVTITGTNLDGATAVTVNGTAGTITGTPTNTSLTFTVGAGSSSGTITVTAPGGSATSTGTFTLTVPAPVVSSVAVPANGTYGIGQNLNFSVTFSQAVTVTGTPTIALTVGATARTAAYVSGSGTSTLVFRYTVPSGDLDANGVALGSAISLNSGTLRNSASTNATLTLNSVGSTASVLVDGVAPVPTLSSSVGTSGSSTPTSPIPFAVSFPESVSGFLIGDIAVTNGAKSALSGSGAGPYTFTVTPTAPGAVTVNIAAGVATDAGSNGNTAATQFSIIYAPLTTAAPTVTDPANGSSDTDTTPTYSGSAAPGSTVTVYVNGVSIGTVNANNGNGNWSKTQSPALADGTYTVYATAQTSGQLVSANSSTNTFTIDNADPTVVISSSAGASGSTTSTNPIPFTVTFSENVSGLAISDITVSGGAKSALTTVSGSQYTFTLTPSGAATYTVNLAANRANDAAGNGNTAATQFSITYAVVPTISSFAPTTGAAGTNVTLTGTNLTGATAVTVNGTAATGVTVVDATHVSFVVPAGASNTQSITVTTPGGTSAASTAFAVRLQVASTNPAANAVAAPRASSALALTFTEPVTAASIAPSATTGIRVFSAQVGGQKAGSFSRSGNTASYTSSLSGSRAGFMPGETVSVTVPATVRGAGGLATTPAVYQFTTATTVGPGTFGAKTDYSTGTNPYDVALGDVNNDGLLDMLTANNGSSTLGVQLGTGTGSFGAITSFATGSGPVALVLGDVNNDGLLDALTANGNSSVSVLLGAGSGSFAAAVSYPTSSAGVALALGDLNADGLLDLVAVTANPGPTAAIWLGTGGGSFGSRTDISSITSSPSGVALADVNNDGRLDLLVTSNGYVELAVKLGTGTGTFGSTATYATGSNPYGLAVGDVNGDGDLDVVTANSGGAGTPNTVSVLLGLGTGGFSAKTDYAIGDRARAVALGDVNGDGQLDIVVTKSFVNSVAVLPNTGAGAFGSQTDYATVGAAYGLALGDLNGDGRLDLVAANSTSSANSASVLLGLPPTTISSLSPAAELPGMPVVITGAGFTAASTVTFGGVAASSVTYNSGTSLTATVPAGAAVGSSTVVVTTISSISPSSPPFSVLAVYNGGSLNACAAAVPATATVNDGAWHYLLSSTSQVVLAYRYTGASLGNFTAEVLRANPASAVRQDPNNHPYLDRNWHLTASGGTFTGRTVQLRFYGLTSEFTRLQAADATVSYATLKATQYSGANEDCQLANNATAGEHRTLSLTASTPGNGVNWFVAETSVADHFSEFYLTGSATPLPVELVAFTAAAKGATVQLNWRTASEKNSARFEIERSLDGRQFAKIGEVAGQGTKVSATDYAYLDSPMPKALSSQAPIYYRLRQVDGDGTASYSPIRAVTLDGKELFTLYPNPAHSAVTVGGMAAGAKVEVFDALGRMVARATADAAGTAQLALPAGLAAGVYVVRSGPSTLRLTVE